MTPEMLVALVVPALAAWAIVALLRRSRWSARLADEPNERSLHTIPTPRIGGLGVMVAGLPVAAMHATPEVAALLGCATVLCVLSLIDDLRDLAIPVRLAVQAACALVAAVAVSGAAGAHMQMGIVESAVAVVAILWMTNLFNFMDGSDGLAGGMSLIGFAAMGTAAAHAGEAPLALASIAIASASAGFLAHNFPPARVFLGDAGSVPLGFLAGALALLGFVRGAWPAWFPLLVFAPFIVDATLTLLRRIAHGEQFWRAHRSHCYQRLVLSGWTQRRLALSAYGLMALGAVGAIVGREAAPATQFGILLGLAVLYLAILVAIERRAPRAVSNE